MSQEQAYRTDLFVILGLIKTQREPEKNQLSLPKLGKMATSVTTAKKSLRVKYVILGALQVPNTQYLLLWFYLFLLTVHNLICSFPIFSFDPNLFGEETRRVRFLSLYCGVRSPVYFHCVCLSLLHLFMFPPFIYL